MQSVRIIDGDGHLNEPPEEVARFLPPPYRDKGFRTREQLVPPLDHLHFRVGETPATRSGRGVVGPEGWLAFLDDVGIESTVLYTTLGLPVGNITSRDWAIAFTRGYNDWLHATYVTRSPRFKGMALLPMQEPEAAVEELRRSVEDLGMCGAMLPSNGLPVHLGSREYWPVYREADRLGCAIGIHGGAHWRMGLDDMNVYTPVNALGHAFGQARSLAGIVFNGIFDKFPNARFGFLEAGVAWFLMCLERFDRAHETHTQIDPRGDLQGPQPDEKVSQYLRRHIEAGRLFVGCEGHEPEIGQAVRRVGNKPFLYSSDFPHEVTNETCKEEIGELLENEDLRWEDKEAILCKNAERFYSLGVPVA